MNEITAKPDDKKDAGPVAAIYINRVGAQSAKVFDTAKLAWTWADGMGAKFVKDCKVYAIGDEIKRA